MALVLSIFEPTDLILECPKIPLFGGLNLCQRLYNGLLKQAWKTKMTTFPDLRDFDGLFWRFYSGVSREIFDILPISSRFSSLQRLGPCSCGLQRYLVSAVPGG